MQALRGVFLTLMLVLGGCGPEYVLTPPPTGEGRLCAGQCAQTEMMCRQNCTMRQQTCLVTERDRADREYDRYVDHQHRMNLDVTRQPGEFVQTSRCSTYSCTESCAGERRSCHQACGGSVVEKK